MKGQSMFSFRKQLSDGGFVKLVCVGDRAKLTLWIECAEARAMVGGGLSEAEQFALLVRAASIEDEADWLSVRDWFSIETRKDD